MLFNSHAFVLFFLPVVLIIWWRSGLNVNTRLLFLTVASYFFYAWWDYRFVTLLLLSTVVDYSAGNYLYRSRSSFGRRAALLLSLTSNLGLLAFFKYGGFLAKSINTVASAVHGSATVPVMDIVLPIGISFYTFQTMSYTIDIYRRQAKPTDSLLHFAAYVSMFPQLIAGPIVRYGELENQLRQIRTTPDWDDMARGIFFFVAGLGQKLLLADIIASRVDPLFANYESMQMGASWFAMLGYATQLYFDFAGYSNMAVGLGLMLGFQFPKNFDSPYRSTNISMFWRRWHITLSFWLRDYLFVPLGGSKGRRWLTFRNLMIVMFLGGLWHGAGWTFICWGLFHAVLIMAHRLYSTNYPHSIPAPLGVLITFLAVTFGWVLFRSTDLSMASVLMASMLGLRGLESHVVQAVGGITSLGILVSFLVGIFALPNLWEISFRPSRIWAIGIGSLLVICVLRFESESPFLYFQF